MQERKPLVGHPFGTSKHAHDQGYGRVKGLQDGRAEFSRSCLAYDLKRVLNILGVPRRLIAAAREGIYSGYAPDDAQGVGIAVARAENFHLNTRCLIRLPAGLGEFSHGLKRDLTLWSVLAYRRNGCHQRFLPFLLRSFSGKIFSLSWLIKFTYRGNSI
jgi:hypothetical protein